MTTHYTPPNVTSGDGSEHANADVFVLPASFAQQRLWLIDQLEPGRPTYNIPFNVRLRGALDVAALEGALSLIVERHETLRTVFDTSEGQPVQVVLPPEPVRLAVTDLSGLPVDEAELELARMVQAEGNRGFDLHRGPIFRSAVVRIAPEDHALLFTVHHIAADGWSMGVLQRELEAAYNALVAGREPELAELPVQYADFALWQREKLSGEALEGQLSYWLDKLRRPLPDPDLPADRPRVIGGARRSGRVPVDVGADVATMLRGLARELNVTPYTALLSAYAILLSRLTGEEDVIVGSPTAGRTRQETEGLIGFFVNSLALRIDLSGAPTFRAVVTRVHETVVGALAHQDLPFDKLVEALEPKRDRTRNPLFQTMFSLQDMPNGGGIALAGLTTSRIGGSGGTAKFDLQLLMHSVGERFAGTLEYDTDLFDAPTAERFARCFVTLLSAIAEYPDCAVSTLAIVDPVERGLLLEDWNRTDAAWPSDATLVSLVAEQAARTPDAIAVASGEATLDYATLDSRSERVASALRAHGVAPGIMVGVCMTRSDRMVIAILGVLKTGAAYVPLDHTYPADRLGFIVDDAAARVVITEGALRPRLTWLDTLLASGDARAPSVLIVDDVLTTGDGRARAGDGTQAPTAPRPEDVAYVIYTSGSTGVPKGVLIEHRNAVALVAWARTVFTREELAGVLGATSICFDLSIFEMFVPLAVGGTVVIAPDALALPDVARVSPVPVTLVNTVPSAIAELLRTNAIPASVRTVNLAGELLPQATVESLYGLPHVERVYDLYGPSEDTTYSTFVLRQRGGRPSIGRPISNSRAYVLDAQQQLLPVGVPGELYLAGAGVARGYLNRAELTAARFVSVTPAAGRTERAYRTGDRVRWRADGTLEYLGRLDHQIKLRGFRIELGEIEATLAKHPAVADCVATVRSDAGDPRLVAYCVPAAAASRRDAWPAVAGELRALLRRTLPEHMVPAAFVPLDALPRSPNGKIDRRALPAPGAVDAADAYVPPRTTLEHELVHIWEGLFDKRPIGIRDDFFELGGHSLLAVQMLHEIELVRGRRLPLASLFEDTTIERLAARIEAQVGGDGEPDLVVLQGDATDVPFAFVHGDVRGGGWYCRRMAPMIDADAPFIVLPTIHAGAKGGALTIEAMARVHLTSLRRAQPHGPYRLGGFCVGGLIAYEMARQLETAGETVETLVLVDTSGVNARFARFDGLLRRTQGDGESVVGLERRAALLRSLRYFSRRLHEVRRMRVGEQVRWARRVVARRLPSTRGRGGSSAAAAGAAAEFSFDQTIAAAEFNARPGTQTLRMQERAAAAYVPQKYSGTVDVIWATDQFPVRATDQTRGWSRVVERVRVHSVKSAHVGLITYNLPLLASTLRACLRPRAAESEG